MSRAHINLEDAADGQFHAKVVFVGGWDKTSHAHQYANIMMNELDQTARRLEEPVLETAPPVPGAGEGWQVPTPSLGR